MTDVLFDEIAEDYDLFRKETRYRKLSRDEWEELNTQYQKTPQIHKIYDNVNFFPSGEHYKLNILLRKYGHSAADRVNSMRVAEDLLTLGWDYE